MWVALSIAQCHGNPPGACATVGKQLATTYLAFLSSERRNFVHLVRENAESSLCGIPRPALSPQGRIDNATVCRECIDWVPKRWTGSHEISPAG
jgi:hypothetical protein